MGNFFKLLIVVAIGFALFGVFKSNPDGTSVSSVVYTIPSSGITFLQDITYVDEEETRFSEQEIFDAVFRMIDRANNYILIDMFLFNDFLGSAPGSYRQLSKELTDALVEKKQSNPNIIIVFITDPINIIYGGYTSPYLSELRNAGVEVVVTNLKPLRDSNPLASGFWRAYFSWFGNSTKEGYLPNPFDAKLPDIGMRSYAALLNFKANHRKVMIADAQTNQGLKFRTLITSANPHDGSSAHTNTALIIDDFIWRDVLESERVVGEFSDQPITLPSDELLTRVINSEGPIRTQLITERKIQEKVVELLNRLEAEDSVDISMFYLSDRKVIQALKKAIDRGAKFRIVLDPNKDAFGRDKNGIPNRQVAFELKDHNGLIDIRWCHTHGEQCHTKMILFTFADAEGLMLGSANLTRRNIGGYNLETNVYLEADTEFTALREAKAYFEKVWNNEEGRVYTIEYSEYSEDSYAKNLLYRFMEDLGISSF
jgi:phosphatidylserine/phosphatidylglycerophosphate/cardiolipin synthase-like enzyme